MMDLIPSELIKDLETLRTYGLEYELIEDNLRIFIIFKNYPLSPSIFNMETTDLMIFTTAQYPNAGFDMFWTNERLMLGNGSVPNAANSLEDYVGRRWRRFSYHPYQTIGWNPSIDSVIRFKSYIDQRLQKGD